MSLEKTRQIAKKCFSKNLAQRINALDEDLYGLQNKKIQITHTQIWY